MRALIVDDSSFIREYLRHLLSRMDITCEEAVDGSDALTVLAGDETFDLMLLDVNMPVMNGLECVKALREAKLGPEMKVMMVTTEADHSFIETALDNGARTLSRPVDPSDTLPGTSGTLPPQLSLRCGRDRACPSVCSGSSQPAVAHTALPAGKGRTR